jgi:hypothetical protein
MNTSVESIEIVENLAPSYATRELNSSLGASTFLTQTRVNSAGKVLGEVMHFGATSETSLALCKMKEQLATGTGVSKTEAGRKLAEFYRTSKDISTLQARIAIELELASGKVFTTGKANKARTTFDLRMEIPKDDAKAKAKALKEAAAQATALMEMRKEIEALKSAKVPTLAELVGALEGDALAEFLAAQAARLTSEEATAKPRE